MIRLVAMMTAVVHGAQAHQSIVTRHFIRSSVVVILGRSKNNPLGIHSVQEELA
jgi:hypothetical protein